MKKILPITLLTFCLCFTTMTSCSPSSLPKLTYGSYIAQDTYGLDNEGGYQISYAQLKEKIQNKETMLVALYPGEDSTCGCWINFQRVIKRYIDNTHNKIYCVNVFEVMSNNDPYGFECFSDSPSFHIIHNEQIIYKSSYKNDSHDIYTSDNLLKQTIDKFVSAPSMYEIGLNEIDEFVNKEQSRIFFSRGKCGDCNYVIPNVLIPYFNKTTSDEKLYVFDIDIVRDDETMDYQAFKDQYGLSVLGNETYGYGVGYVPTFQYRENGQIKYSSVYFNDTIASDDNGYYVQTSYYTNERLSTLSYLSNSEVETKVLEGLRLSDDEVFAVGEYIGWHQEKAAKYHDPILTSFLDSCFK